MTEINESMLIRGLAIGNIPCKHEAELQNRKAVKYFSFRILIQAVRFTGESVWYVPTNLPSQEDRGLGVTKTSAILEGSYEYRGGTLDKAYELESMYPSDIQAGNRKEKMAGERYEFSLSSRGVHSLCIKANHQSDVRDRIRSYYIKLFANKDNVSLLQPIGAAGLPQGDPVEYIEPATLISRMNWHEKEHFAIRDGSIESVRSDLSLV